MLAPQDVFIDQRYIYILDRQHGIYIYKLFGTGEVKEHDWIELNTYGNTKILGKEKTIFVNYNDENGDKII